ncbi:MAG: NADH-quinone oxidoreductase subunit N [Egibacteraceae bacterium]
MPIPHIVPQIALVVGAMLALVVVIFLPRRLQAVGAPLALVALAVAVVTQADLAAGEGLLTFDRLWALDGATSSAAIIICVATGLVVLLAPEWLRSDARHGEYYPLLLLSALGAIVMAGAADLNELMIGLLMATVPGYVLASYHRRSALSAEAGMKYFLLGGLTNSLMLIGLTILYGLAGTTLYADFPSSLAQRPTAALVAAVGLVAVGLAFELGAAPAHAWIPDVAEGAPAPSAAFLTVVPKIGAFIGLARLLSVLPPEAVGWRPLVALLAAVTMTLGNLAALSQEDVRRVLGWSSVSQTGYGLMAIVALGRSELALPALLFFLLAYAVANIAAFGVVTELRGRTALSDYAGLSRSRPWLAAALVLAMLSLVGIPPLVGFAAKLNLFVATIEAGYAWLAALAVANTVVSLVYYLRVAAPMYFGTRTRPVAVLGQSAATSVALAVGGVLVLGLLAGPLLSAFSGAALLP